MQRRDVFRWTAASAAFHWLGRASAASADSAAVAAPDGRPIYITVGLQAGTGSDIAVRSMAEQLGRALGRATVTENMPGAGGVLAAAKVALSPADGSALFALSNGTLSVAPLLQQVHYDPLKDLQPVAYISGFPSVLIVSRDFPARSFAEFLAVARQRPGKITYGSGGVGSVQHLATESLKASAGIDLLHVPYKGSLQATVDIAGGQIDCMLNGISTVLPYVQSGQVRVLAACGDRRISLVPDVPTISEAGVPGYSYEPWTGFYAPPGTPAAVVNRYNAAVRKIASGNAQLNSNWASLGIVARDLDVDQMNRLIRGEYEINRQLIRDKNIHVE